MQKREPVREAVAVFTEEKARKILARPSGQDVHIHGVPDHKNELELFYAGPPKEDGVQLDTKIYRDTRILKSEDGHCFVRGRIFATQADAHRFIVEAEGGA